MFKKILIANRGEIAVRVIQACRELDIRTVAVFSEPDKDSKHVAMADETWRLEGQPGKVYLDYEQILDIAKRSGAEAVHPGYGFLSENTDFARACIDKGIKFIGPEPEVILRMGSKVESRRVMQDAGVPVVPGTTDPVTTPEEVKKLATKYGYPLAIKASAGGGGRGLRVVRKDEDVENALAGAQREGATYFGSAEVYVEKYLDKPRHIEVQVLGDEHGNVVHLYERDCSSQRRHQKLVEETPAAKLDAKLKERLLEAAVIGTKALNYTSAGTLEFMVAQDEFYFLEMNTRVQVEHPITEMTTGVDIVKEQISISFGNPLSFKQSEVFQRGHAIECRINAEDVNKNFMPNPGELNVYKEPSLPWVRVDSACYPGYKVVPFYDSLLAKLVVWGRTRAEAVARTRLALRDFKIEGVSTTIPFHLAMMDDPTFEAGEVHTSYVEGEMMKNWKQLQEKYSGKCAVNGAAGAAVGSAESANGGASGAASAASSNGGAEVALERSTPRAFEIEVNQRMFKVAVSELVDPSKPRTIATTTAGAQRPATATRTNRKVVVPTAHTGDIRSTMNGVVKEILVKEGDKVEAGQKVITFEAMKMESDLVSLKAGTVTSIKVKLGETVESDVVLMTIGD
ncbi:MAG: acetyl-CoA carboxylase biotin carboxylase subunit [Candidatus Melainabacteria bacterium]|nr:acetyl-CoA carboxylase biotin carboxylase subunit [Candidatus Melainabacteria bacterium]